MTGRLGGPNGTATARRTVPTVDGPEELTDSRLNRAAAAGRAAVDNLEAFYSRPIGWWALLVTLAYLAYGGGAVMFWVHALVRGEAGPAISDLAHWLLDSTLGFLALGPAVFVLLPVALWAVRRLKDGRIGVRSTGFVVLVGTVFGVVTIPGPALHNLLAGAGTPLAEMAERILGRDPAVAARNLHAVDHSAWSESVVQLVVGVPVYLVAAALALLTVRRAAGARRRRLSPRELIGRQR
ncbi:MAG: hypothetical protein ACT4OM_13845 [Actinomycetota bacterium]